VNSCHPRQLEDSIGQLGSQRFQEVELAVFDDASGHLMDVHIVDGVGHVVAAGRAGGVGLNLQVDDEQPPSASLRLRDTVVPEKVELPQEQAVGRPIPLAEV
jgi:hypothetical protein